MKKILLSWLIWPSDSSDAKSRNSDRISSKIIEGKIMLEIYG